MSVARVPGAGGEVASHVGDDSFDDRVGHAGPDGGVVGGDDDGAAGDTAELAHAGFALVVPVA